MNKGMDERQQDEFTEKAHQEEIDNAQEAGNEAAPEDSTESDRVQDQEIEQLQTQLKEISDKYLRQVAEFDNFRKRTAREKTELIKSGTEDLMKALLEVLDDSDRALQQMQDNEDLNLHKDGILLVFNKLNKILQHKGLKAMEAKDKDFDADMFEAITEIPAPTEEMKGKVLDEVQKGYYLNDKIIRHAKVVIGK